MIEKEIFLSLAVSHETLDIQYADFERHWNLFFLICFKYFILFASELLAFVIRGLVYIRSC